tara:strand:+ start:1427 stop:2467 length:1041 start_codon:yes stop_codon:yes gene_type:complete
MYIKNVLEQNKNIYVSYWLLLITILVSLIIVVGGLTRLTDSGLSITRWDLFSGIVPPLNYDQWDKFFTLYKGIPEFKILNSSMTLSEFKVIFWWEYAHRLLGRIIGIFYLLPLLYFTFTEKIEKKTLPVFYLILILIILQGFIGWYMVQSGLVEKTDVSHYRLSVHLTLAFIIFILLLWSFLNLSKTIKVDKLKKIPYFLPSIFLFLVLIQISFGALVSGLDAGQIYNTWPLMNQSYFPDDAKFITLLSTEMFETPSILQFIHRNIAYGIFLFFLLIFFIARKLDSYNYLKNAINLVFLSLLLQIFLGILAVLYNAHIFIASLHQIGSIILITSVIILIFKNSKIS